MRLQRNGKVWAPECECGFLNCHGQDNCHRPGVIRVSTGVPRLADGHVCAECDAYAAKMLPGTIRVAGEILARTPERTGA